MLPKNNLPPLIRDRIGKNKKYIFVDQIQTVFELLEIQSAIKEDEILILAKNTAVFKHSKWLKRLIKSARVFQFNWHVFSFADRFKAEDQAFDRIEELYAQMKSHGQIPFSPLEKLYGRTDCELAFKKELIVELTEYLRTISALHCLKREGMNVEFTPSWVWLEIHSLLKNYLPESLPMIPFQERKIKNIFLWGERLKLLLSMLMAVPWILIHIRKIANTRPKLIQLAVRLYKTDFGMHGQGTPESDWVIDGKRFTKDNTLFVGETPLYKQYEEEIEKREYLYMRLDYRFAFCVTTWKFLKELLFKTVHILPSLFLKNLKSPSFIIKISNYAWLDYFRWKNFLGHWRPKFYFAYHDIFSRHVFRNILLNQAGCETWYLDHSHSKLSTFDDGKEISGRQAIRAYMQYDREIHWGKGLVKFAQTHFNFSKLCVAYGPIWNNQVGYSEPMAQLIHNQWPGDKGLLIVAFATNISLDGINSEETHFAFLNALESLLNDPRFPDLKIILKTKNLDYEQSLGLEGTEAPFVFERLKQHPRFLNPSIFTSASGLIYFADLIISMAFASPTLEALIAGKRAIYYDHGNQFPNSFFAQFPKMIARDQRSLTELMDYWLRLPEADFKSFLNLYIFSEYGGIEKPAMELIREELSLR